MDQKLIWFFLLGKVLADQKTFTKNVQDFKKIICISILLFFIISFSPPFL
jgi:hypothetical protein